MDEQENAKKKDRDKDFRRSWSWFLALSALVTVLTICAFYFWHSNNACRQDRIFELCRTNVELSDSLLKSAHKELLDSLRDNPGVLLADYQILERMSSVSADLAERHSAVAILEIEANKIQNQYEALGIWGAIITILFLIFSFYSLFKSEQLRKEGVEALEYLRGISQKASEDKHKIDSYSSDANTRLDKLDKDASNKLEAIRQDADSKLETLGKSIAELFANVSNIEQRVADIIESSKKQIEEVNGVESDSLKKYIDSCLETLANENRAEYAKLDFGLSSLQETLHGIDEHLRELDDAIFLNTEDGTSDDPREDDESDTSLEEAAGLKTAPTSNSDTSNSREQHDN